MRLASDLADALTTQAERVKRQCAELESALQGLSDLSEAAPAQAQATPAPSRHNSDSHGEQSPARLAAMEMSIQGASREQIDAYLRETLGVTDTGAILTDVLKQRDDG